ncbi:MAG TPA: bifunctional salicylyl-CoA 5-hydroxylase/oxidoreductase [Candidatus Thermoplasmatota archaeon]|nr:bifunctional salicylyl-CoA 5-hydroxylase/oxidoreductase [Candidatus Thermoplasmatota archaeon]
MRIAVVGGGPAGLYFSILMKRADPTHEVTVYERNRPDDTFGFGVVFSDAAVESLESIEPETYHALTKRFYHWDDIEVTFRGNLIRSSGHGFSGISRKTLIETLEKRATQLGVKQIYGKEVASPKDLGDPDLIVAADGSNSTVRQWHAKEFNPQVDQRPNKFVWLGTDFPFPAFTFYFKENPHGLWRVHAYRYDEGHSTFIVETRDETWRKAGLENATEDETIVFCEKLFADELRGHKLLKNRSLWRSFPIIKCGRWHHKNVVLLGDAAHTTHFSIGSGTKLALEDAVALRDALVQQKKIPDALESYEKTRRPIVDSFQRAAQVSLTWFEDTERYMRHPPIRFGFSLLTRSFRVTHDELKRRDPAYVAAVDRWFAEEARKQSGVDISLDPPPSPMFTPFKLRDVLLQNRIVVSPMCMYRAEDGTIDDWHLVHLGSRAVGGAGLVIAEMTDVSREGRISPGCAGMYKDEHVAQWKRVTDFAHKYSDAKMGMQLGHAGRKGSTKVSWEGIDEPLESGGWPVLAPSAIPWSAKNPVPKPMTRADMDKVLEDFVRATKMSERSGFDWLELHMAHGYLLATFLSPLTNQRKDEYGGSLENRLRFPLEVFDAVRKAWPKTKPISVRISATDWAQGGNDAADAVEVWRTFKAHGCDIIDVSAGQTVPHGKPVYGRQFQTPFSERVRLDAGIPTMAVGNISSYTDVNTILAAGRADLCVLARAHLYDPYWTRHAAQDLGFKMAWPDPYESMERYTPRFK